MISIKKDEKLISVYRRHKFIIFLELAPLVIFSVLIMFAAWFLIYFVLSDALFVPIVLFFMFVFLHIFWIAAFIYLADYYLDIWILTDKRVITIEQKSLFSRVLSEFELSKIQEISVDIHGVLPTIIDYGDVTVRTASENQNFIFKQVGNPNKVKDDIMLQAEKYTKKRFYG